MIPESTSIRDLALKYVIRECDDEEASRCNQLHRERDPVFLQEVQSWTHTLGAMLFHIPSHVPSNSLKARLRDRIRETPQESEKPTPEPTLPTVVFHDDVGFIDTECPGVSIKTLFVDPEQRTTTMIVRMAPGTEYPSHCHGGVEECLVLEGDLHCGDLVMKKNDYQRLDAGTIHAPQRTTQGCLLFVRSSLDDKLVA